MTGLPLTEIVHGADVQDRDGGPLVIKNLGNLYQLLEKIFADAGYQGPKFRNGVAAIRKQLVVDIVKRSDYAKGFVLLPKRWVVERTFAWLGRCRRLAKDWENLTRNALAFLKLAAIRLMLRKLCNHS
jgi:transposase